MGRRVMLRALVGAMFLLVLGTSVSAAPAAPEVHLTAVGDFAQTTNTGSVLTALAASGADATLALGDMSYGAVGGEQGWCDFVTGKIGAGFPFELLSGNHESNGLNGNINDFSACLPNQLPGAVGTYGRQYYVDVPAGHPLVRMIMISPGLTYPDGTWDYSAGSARYQWTAQAIDSARSSGVPWVVVGMHKPCVTVGKYACDSGADLFNLLLSKKVDLVLSGHEHSYQRSHQLGLSAGLPHLRPRHLQRQLRGGHRLELRRRGRHGGHGGGYGRAASLRRQRRRPRDPVLRLVGRHQQQPDLRLPGRAPHRRHVAGLVRPRRRRHPGGLLHPDPRPDADESAAGRRLQLQLRRADLHLRRRRLHRHRRHGRLLRLELRRRQHGDGRRAQPRLRRRRQLPGHPDRHRQRRRHRATDRERRAQRTGDDHLRGRPVHPHGLQRPRQRSDRWRLVDERRGRQLRRGQRLRALQAGGWQLAGGRPQLRVGRRHGRPAGLPGRRPGDRERVYVSTFGRRISGQGGYAAKTKITSTGAVTLELVRTPATGSEVSLQAATTVSGLTYATGDTLNVRVQTTGSAPTTVRAKVWKAGTPEPTTWLRSTTDSTAGLQAPGAVGVGAYLSSTATSPLTLGLDSFVVTAP